MRACRRYYVCARGIIHNRRIATRQSRRSLTLFAIQIKLRPLDKVRFMERTYKMMKAALMIGVAMAISACTSRQPEAPVKEQPAAVNVKPNTPEEFAKWYQN